VPDILIREAEAKSRGDQPVEVEGLLVAPVESNHAFDQALARAVARGRAMGIPEYGMNLRARLRGRVVRLPEEQSGFTRGFEVDDLMAVEVCPRLPRSINGCSN
jgi:hypothetical protein